ncbi:MAG TPA: RNA methyltransferase [Mycobacterium sp.]|nr:RNA methyltransferase [Mycobacterium sp.]
MAAAIKLHRHVGRRRAARFLAEGPNLVEAALRRGLVSEVFATESAVSRFGAVLTGAPVHLVTERAAKALSETVTPVGLVAVCSLPHLTLADAVADGPRLVAVAVEISEPGNAGTLIRIADAMGADAVVLAGHSVDPYNGKCLRASAGSIFWLPVVAEPDAVQAVASLGEAGLQVLASTVDGEVSLDDAALDAPTAWLFGPESHGLPRELADMATHRVRIPMPGSAESLNVASAASICLYQSARAARSN